MSSKSKKTRFELPHGREWIRTDKHAPGPVLLALSFAAWIVASVGYASAIALALWGADNAAASPLPWIAEFPGLAVGIVSTVAVLLLMFAPRIVLFALNETLFLSESREQEQKESYEHKIEQALAWVPFAGGQALLFNGQFKHRVGLGRYIDYVEYKDFLFDVLSLGRMMGNEVLPADTPQGFLVWQPKIEKEQSMLKDLTRIWASALNGIQLSFLSLDQKDELITVGSNLGIGSMIDAYMAGVPIDDIAA